MLKNLSVLLFGFILLFLPQAHGALSPISVGIVPPVQFPPGDFAVTGVRVSALWGKHRNMYGFDFGGLGNITEQNFVGVGISGLFNMTEGTTTIIGLQAAGATNINTNKANIYGLQLALVNANKAAASVVGFDIAPIANLCPYTTVYGFQVGLYNKALEVYGFQIGLINSVSSLHGLQIGLINFNERGLFSVSPILNFGF